jgi:two-component system NtrC family sensor kinase
LAHAEQMAVLGQMAANVAHQVGTPLNLISGYVQVMKEDARADPPTLHRLQTVEAQIRKVTDAVRTMLDSARRPVLQRQAVDVGTLVEQVCEVSRPALHAANVDVQLDLQRPLPSLFADPVQLELALFNLVSNSLDAMPHGGRLEMTLSATPTGIRLVVADSGTGIPPEVLPRIFEPWVTTKPAGRGTGLGLSITRDTIASHGGMIDVRSEPGRGTVFTIDLPASETATELGRAKA